MSMRLEPASRDAWGNYVLLFGAVVSGGLRN
jgi:hypothetical protein